MTRRVYLSLSTRCSSASPVWIVPEPDRRHLEQHHQVGNTGFKGQDVNFQDLIYQASSFASAPTQQSGGVNGSDFGLGVKIGAINSDFTQTGFS